MTYAAYMNFFAFVGIAFLVYLIVPLKHRWVTLLAAGVVFYLVLNGFLTAFLAVTVVSVFFCAKQLEKLQNGFNAKKKELSKDERKQLKNAVTNKKKAVVALAVVINLGILVFLKYYNFFAGQISALWQVCGFSGSMPVLRLLLPLGISYYTLQAIGYVVDVYRGRCAAENNLGKLALFISFFPQMTEGPIGRYQDLAPQLTQGHRYTNENFTGGMTLILWGLFKKMVISDRASFMANTVFKDYESYSGTMVVVAVILYTIQLYTDFSGCIDIMSGTARLFGIRLADNFRQPFFAKSVAEFWRRWHITLGTWFKDYVFYPVSLSTPFTKLSKASQKHFNKFFGAFVPTAAALLIVWLGTGLWHGASTKYIVYGLYYFLLIMLGMLFEPLAVKLFAKTKINRKGKLWGGIATVRTVLLVLIGMMLFRAGNEGDFFNMLGMAVTKFNVTDLFSKQLFELGTDGPDFLVIFIGVVLMLVVAILKERGHDVLKSVATGRLPLKWAVMIGLIMAVVIFGAYGASYAPVDPIYAQF